MRRGRGGCPWHRGVWRRWMRRQRGRTPNGRLVIQRQNGSDGMPVVVWQWRWHFGSDGVWGKLFLFERWTGSDQYLFQSMPRSCLFLTFHFSFYVQLGYNVFSSSLDPLWPSWTPFFWSRNSLCGSRDQKFIRFFVGFPTRVMTQCSLNFVSGGSTSYLAPRVLCEVVSAFFSALKKHRNRQCDKGNGVEQCTIRVRLGSVQSI